MVSLSLAAMAPGAEVLSGVPSPCTVQVSYSEGPMWATLDRDAQYDVGCSLVPQAETPLRSSHLNLALRLCLTSVLSFC